MAKQNLKKIAEDAKKAIGNVEELLDMLDKVEDMAYATKRLVDMQVRNSGKFNAVDPRDLDSKKSSREIEK